MKRFRCHAGTATTVLVLLLSGSVWCIANSKSVISVDGDRNWKAKDTQTAGSSLWSPASEYYDDRDRNVGGYKKDFITSYEDKYPGNSPPYGNKFRLGSSTFSGGSYYTPGGTYDRRPFYGSAGPSVYGVQDYDGAYEYGPHGQGYSLNYPYGGKDLTRSVLLPLAGATLLGIAAALVANPVLLHLGVSAGKRKRREISPPSDPDIAYRGQLSPTVRIYRVK
ncbi:uncharacterized protein LOC131207105 [Anopheles bellator]|uniref:uncharacterized protein LOC131207105 n=1 Tax=Anopheles bellator TaxID=139047 RepID=UPI0026499130|nr:uncharacterized protein LOC131207105 [Anopheles bellator]